MNVVSGLVGGALIGLGAVWLYLSIGRIAGISGVAAQALALVTPSKSKATEAGAPRQWWPLLFIVGLGAGGWLAQFFRAYLGSDTHQIVTQAVLSGDSLPWLLVGGVLVGFGTRLGSGCTSGHGVCGMARLSRRSITATITFLLVGIITATLAATLGVGLT